MSREVELKLEIDPADAVRLNSHPLFHEEPHRARLTAVYFDTPKGRLRRRGWTLRVRQEDDRWVQTIKHAGEGAGLFDREEWGSEVSGPQPEQQAIAGTPLKALIKTRHMSGLVPVMRSEVTRWTWVVSAGGATIEVTYDEGRVEAGDLSEPVNEMELELKEGDTGPLFSVAKRINARIPVKLGVLAKPERGFALVDGQRGKPVKASPVELTDKMNVAEAFAAIVTACLKHFRMNEPLFIGKGDAEALHQLRVAIRRIRSALWLFRPVVKDGEFANANNRLRHFTRELGTARNIDVILASMRAKDPARDQLERDRRQLYGRIVKRLNSRAFRNFVIDLLSWIHIGQWRSGRKADKPLIPFATKRLDRLWKKIDERGTDLALLSDTELHRLRIDTKKIRYALQFLEQPLRMASPDQQAFVDEAEGVQDSLGCLNDLVTRRAIVAVGAPQSLIDKETARHLRAAKRHLDKMRKIGPFWRAASG